MKLEWRDVSIGDGPPIHTSLTLAETAELQRLAAGADVLEVGSAYGYSAVAMALVGAAVVAVDPHQQLNSLHPMLANLAAYGVAVEIRNSPSWSVLPELVGEGRLFDLVWIDGDHAAEMVEHDVNWARKLLRPTGTLTCHDYLEDTCPGVAEALDAWKRPPKVVDTLAVYGPGEW